MLFRLAAKARDGQAKEPRFRTTVSMLPSRRYARDIAAENRRAVLRAQYWDGVLGGAATSASCLLWLKSFEHGCSNRQRKGGMAAGSSFVQCSPSYGRAGLSPVHDRSLDHDGCRPGDVRHERRDSPPR